MIKNKGVLGLFGIIVLSIFLFISFGGSNLFTVISQSQVSYDEVTNKWLSVQIAVDSADKLDFSASQLTDTSLQNADKAYAKKGFSLTTSPEQPVCVYNLNWKTYPLSIVGFAINSVPYAETQLNVMKTPYTLTITRTDGVKETKVFDTSLIGSGTANFFDGQVQVFNIGAFSRGYQCPAGSNVVLIPIYTDNKISSWKAVSRSDWLSLQSQYNSAINNCLFNPFSCFGQVSNLLSQPPVGDSADWRVFQSTNVSTITQGILTLNGYLPKGSSVANISIQADAKFVDTVVIQKPNGQPQLSFIINKTSNAWKTGESAIITATIKNTGTTSDTFRIIPSSGNGLINFNPLAQETGNLETNVPLDISFSSYAMNSGTGQICLQAVAIGSGKTVSTCKNISIEQTNLPVLEPGPVIQCGNGTCDVGEDYSYCPVDCVNPNPALPICGNSKCETGEQITCAGDCSAPVVNIELAACNARKTDWLTIGWNYVPAGLLTPSDCKPVQNWILVAIAGLIVCGIVGVFYFKSKKKSRR